MKADVIAVIPRNTLSLMSVYDEICLLEILLHILLTSPPPPTAMFLILIRKYAETEEAKRKLGRIKNNIQTTKKEGKVKTKKMMKMID